MTKDHCGCLLAGVFVLVVLSTMGLLAPIDQSEGVVILFCLMYGSFGSGYYAGRLSEREHSDD